MLISTPQLEANRANALHSTGPVTPEGKAGVRYNALKHGLRARSTVLPFEIPEEFQELLDDLYADWQPQTCTERLHVEQMAIQQWHLRRLANFEGAILTRAMDPVKQMELLERFAAQTRRLEQSFSKTIRDLEHLQQRRPRPAQVKPQVEVQPEKPPAPEPVIHPEPCPERIPPPMPGHRVAMSADSR